MVRFSSESEMSVLEEPSSLVPSVMQVQAKDKEKHHVQTKRLYAVRNQSNSESARISCGISNGVYVNRAFGGDCHCCVIDGDIAANAPAGQETG